MNLVTLPDDRLFTKSAPVLEIDAELQEICQNMVDTMHQSRGVGLAGVQVGIMKRVFVVHVEDDIPRVFINPELSQFSDEKDFYEEGCLSIPGVYAQIERPIGLHVDAFDLSGKAFSMDVEGFLARVIQHEFDHLEGRLFFQYLTERKQSRFLQSYARLNHIAL